MEGLAGVEFAALRDTIRSRGGARPLAFLAGAASWAVAWIAVVMWLPNPIASLVPLLVLLATFEVVRTLHLGVERIGRYIQVFFEEAASGRVPTGPPAWEHTAMMLGPNIPGVGAHAFFQPVFVLAITVNFLAVLLPGPVMIELAMLSVPHLAFVGWMFYCDRGMRKQRETELARFRELKRSLTTPPPTTQDAP